jgi:hypothetical protein
VAATAAVQEAVATQATAALAPKPNFNLKTEYLAAELDSGGFRP